MTPKEFIESMDKLGIELTVENDWLVVSKPALLTSKQLMCLGKHGITIKKLIEERSNE